MNTINANKYIRHFKLKNNFGICTAIFCKVTTSIKKIECLECIALERYFRGNYKLVLCYSRNDLIQKGVLHE